MWFCFVFKIVYDSLVEIVIYAVSALAIIDRIVHSWLLCLDGTFLA